MTSGAVWRERVAREIEATAEPVEDLGPITESVWATPWPTERGPFMIKGRWRLVDGQTRMVGLDIAMVETADQFLPLTTTALRMLRLPEIDRQLLSEVREFVGSALDPHTSTTRETASLLQAARDALSSEPKPKRGPQRVQDVELLTKIATTYDAAQGIQPVRAVLRMLVQPNSPYRAEFAYTDQTSLNRRLAKISRLVARARELQLIKTPKQTAGRQSAPTNREES